MKSADKIKEVESALQVIIKHCPCYGERVSDPVSIEIGNGLKLKDRDGTITSGFNRVAEELIKRYGRK